MTTGLQRIVLVAAGAVAAVGIHQARTTPSVFRASATLRPAAGVAVALSEGVVRLPGTRLVAVSADAPTARAAADAANARADDIVGRHVGEATRDIDRQLDETRQELAAWRATLERTAQRQREAAARLGAAPPAAATLARLSDRLDRVERQLVPLAAALERLEADGTRGSILALTNDPYVQRAREALLIVERERDRALLRYGSNHPAVKRLEEFVVTAGDTLRLTEHGVLTALRADRDVLDGEAAILRGRLSDAVAAMHAEAAIRERVRLVAAEHAEARQAHTRLVNREIELRQVRAAAAGALRVMERAAPPLAPLPGPGRWYALASGLLLALAATLTRMGRAGGPGRPASVPGDASPHAKGSSDEGRRIA